MKNHLNCVIIDDEPLAQSLIKKFIERVPYLSLQATYDNAITATHGINNLQPDIIFLDVNMPEMNGIEFLRSLVGQHPQVVFITAHQQYAYEGFEQDAVDYLLKPVAFSRFMKAIHKVEKRLSFSPTEPVAAPISDELAVGETSPMTAAPRPDEFFLVKEDKKLTKIALSDIIYIEGMKDYIKIHVADRFIITHMTMAKMMKQLPEQFLRINRSFIIQIALIKQLEGNMITMSNGDRLTIGINYRNTVRDMVKQWML